MRRRAAGFTYIGLLVAVVVMGIGLAEVGVIWRTQAQRERSMRAALLALAAPPRGSRCVLCCALPGDA